MINNKNIILLSLFSSISIIFQFIQKFIFKAIFPFGGSISISMIPVMIISIRLGSIYGLLCGLLISFINILFTNIVLCPLSIYVMILQFFLDYLITYPLVGTICGLFSKKIYLNKNKNFNIYLYLSILLSGISKNISHIISGYFWNKTLFLNINLSPLAYSIIINSLYSIPSIIICLIVINIIYKKQKHILFNI